MNTKFLGLVVAGSALISTLSSFDSASAATLNINLGNVTYNLEVPSEFVHGGLSVLALPLSASYAEILIWYSTYEVHHVMTKRSLKTSEIGQARAKQAMLRKGWTQDYLATEAGLSTRNSVWKFLSGRPIDRNIFRGSCSKRTKNNVKPKKLIQ